MHGKSLGEEMSLGQGAVHILYNASGVGVGRHSVMLRYIGGEGSRVIVI